MVLASQAALRDCLGDAPLQDKAEEDRMTAALQSSFSTADEEVLQQAREEGSRDGATAVVVLRTGTSSPLLLCNDATIMACYESMKGCDAYLWCNAFCFAKAWCRCGAGSLSRIECALPVKLPAVAKLKTLQASG